MWARAGVGGLAEREESVQPPLLFSCITRYMYEVWRIKSGSTSYGRARIWGIPSL